MTNLDEIEIDGITYGLGGLTVDLDDSEFGEPNQVDADTLGGKPASEYLTKENLSDYIKKSEIYPIGSIYISLNSTNPSSIFGGTWEQIQGRFLLGVNSSHPVNQTGGQESHSHGLSKAYAQIGFSYDTSNFLAMKTPTYIAGYSGIKMSNLPGYGNASNLQLGTPIDGNTDSSNNMPPYLAVYMWKRTA